jgi:zinc transport system substrate-binding protein
MGYATIHIEVEGEYGFAHSSELNIFLMMAEGGHDDHDDHAGHDDHGDEDAHDDHGDEDAHDDHGDEDAHDDHGDEEGHDEELAFDPHSWLDPLAFKVQADVVLQHLIDVFPEGEDTFTANAEEFKSALDALHVGFDAALNEGVCTDKTVVANHNAYSYMAYRYDIQFLTVHGLDPEGEPSAEDVAEVVEHINEEGITVLFVEEYTDQSSVQSIVDETGVSIKILYTMEMAPTDAEDDYMSMMQKNLDNMLSGMGC